MRKTLNSICTTFLLTVLMLIPTAALSQPISDYKYSPPAKLNDDIPTGTLRSVKLLESTLTAGTNEILKGTYANIHSLLILRDSKLVFEKYFGGEDENNRLGEIGFVNHNRETLHDIRSITKSVVGLAVLIAHSQGAIKNLDQPVFDLFPEYVKYAEGDKKQITIRHLLTMTPGLDWNEELPPLDPKNTHFQMNNAPDPIEYVLSRRSIKEPGSAFEYNSGTTQLLAVILKKTTGMNVEQLLKTHLLGPLGIKKFEFSKWTGGEPDADSGLRLRSRDLAKIGMLLMNDGKWKGKQVIPAKLVEDVAKPWIKVSEDADGWKTHYGYQTWLQSFTEAGKGYSVIEFSGNGGQKVLIDRKNDFIVVITAGNYDAKGLKKYSFDILLDIVYPAMKD
jgi:CubicO group peptidase (beta-lactamase class C family)